MSMASSHPSLSDYVDVARKVLRDFDLSFSDTLYLIFYKVYSALLKPRSYLDVPSAKLCYETKGAGPLLLLIPGANGDGMPFDPITIPLSRHFTVCTYARRGFSASKLTAEQDYSARLQTDADDAALLITHLSPSKPAYVLGNSSGAVVSMELLKRHPDKLAKVLLHEPPKMKADPNGSEFSAFMQKLVAQYREQGIPNAVRTFAAQLGQGTEIDMLRVAMMTSSKESNVRYWFEHEADVYPLSDYDPRPLKQHMAKVELLLGVETKCIKDQGGNAPLYGPLNAISRDTGKAIVITPGGHVGFIIHPQKFAQVIIPLLNADT
jgi:pimeloyl-ACP methyl ester carboxylesterase